MTVAFHLLGPFRFDSALAVVFLHDLLYRFSVDLDPFVFQQPFHRTVTDPEFQLVTDSQHSFFQLGLREVALAPPVICGARDAHALTDQRDGVGAPETFDELDEEGGFHLLSSSRYFPINSSFAS